MKKINTSEEYPSALVKDTGIIFVPERQRANLVFSSIGIRFKIGQGHHNMY